MNKFLNSIALLICIVGDLNCTAADLNCVVVYFIVAGWKEFSKELKFLKFCWVIYTAQLTFTCSKLTIK